MMDDKQFLIEAHKAQANTYLKFVALIFGVICVLAICATFGIREECKCEKPQLTSVAMTMTQMPSPTPEATPTKTATPTPIGD